MFQLRKYLVKPTVAVCLALGSTSAMAYLPTNNDDGAVTVYWGGATASTQSAMELTVTAVCASDTHILYVPAGGTAANPKRPGNDWAVACNTSLAKTGLPDGTRVLVVKRDRGGSGVGVGPVQTKGDGSDANVGRITFLDVSSVTCPAAAVGTPGVNGAPAITNPAGGLEPLQECAATYNQSRYTEMGTSDIEPDKFFGTNVNEPNVDGAGLPFRTETDRAFAERSTLAGLAFNTPITLALRNVLQTEQFLATNVCNPAHPSYNLLTDDLTDRADATNAESQACMPSLTRSEIASMMTGTVVNWNQLLRANNTPILPAGLPIQICRRVAGSGTQATINALIMGWPGDPGSTIDIALPRTPNTPVPGTVVGNSGSSDVDTCLHNFNATANPYAIGNLSVEGRNTDNLRNWRYIKIDGLAPTLANIHGGNTYMWAQQSCQRRNNSLPYNPGSAPATDTVLNKTRVYTALCGTAASNGLNNFGALALLNNNAVYTWGQSGWLASPTAAASNVADAVLNIARPVNMFTRDAQNLVLNILQVPRKATAGANAGRGMIVVGP